MAREPQVTRTIKTTEVEVMVIDLSTKDVTTEVHTVLKTPEAKKLTKVLEEKINDGTKKVVSIMGTTVVETLYGMNEEDFIKVASVIPVKDFTSTPEQAPEAPATVKPAKNRAK